MGQLLFTRLDQRLAGYLEDERIRTGSPVLSTTHEQIARNLGSAREVVSRTLKSFEKEASSHSPAARSRFSMSKSSAASAGCADSSSTRADIFPQALPCRSRKYFSKAF